MRLRAGFTSQRSVSERAAWYEDDVRFSLLIFAVPCAHAADPPEPPGLQPSGPAYDGPHHCGEARVRYACALTDGRVLSVCGDHPADLTATLGPLESTEENGTSTGGRTVRVGNHGSLSSRSGMGFEGNAFRTSIVFIEGATTHRAVATKDLGGLEVDLARGRQEWVSCTTAPKVDFWMLDLLSNVALPPGGARADGETPRPDVPEAKGTLCEAHQMPVFSCALENGKQVAVCAPRTYRFGTPGNIELEHVSPIFYNGGPAGFSQWTVDGETRTSFYTTRPWRYELFSSPGGGGVRVFSGEDEKAELRCADPPVTRYEHLSTSEGRALPPWYGGE